MTTRPAAHVTVARNRPTRTADYGPAPEGHPLHGRTVGTGRGRRPARWTRLLRSGSTFQVDAQELTALIRWAEANLEAAADLTFLLHPPEVVHLEEAPPADQDGPGEAQAVQEATDTAEARATLLGHLEAPVGRRTLAQVLELGRRAGLALEGAEELRTHRDLEERIRLELEA